MADLREELAQRLCDATLPLMGDATPWQTAQHHTQQYYRKMADECLRQMEWAFAQGWHHGVEHGTDTRPPLTLAPEEWKP